MRVLNGRERVSLKKSTKFLVRTVRSTLRIKPKIDHQDHQNDKDHKRHQLDIEHVGFWRKVGLASGKRSAFLIAVVVSVFVLVVTITYVSVRALPDLSDNWNFSTPSNYTISSGLSTSGSSVQLNGYQLPTDANTGALYHFNETSGANASDSSGNNNTLVGVNNIWGTGSAYGGATFNGTNTSFAAPDTSSISLGTNQSIEAKIKLNSAFDSTSSSDQFIVDKGDYKLYLDHNTGKLVYALETSSGSSPTNAQAVSGSNGRSYINGQVVYGSDIYYGMSDSPSDYQGANGFGDSSTLWRYNSTTNTTNAIGAFTAQTGLTGLTVSIVTMSSNGSTLYVAGGANIYSCDMSAGCGTLTDLGRVDQYYDTNSITHILYQNGHLYATTGNDFSDACPSFSLYVWGGGTTWTAIGGGCVSSPASWQFVASSGSSTAGIYSLVGDGSASLYTSVSNGTVFNVYKCAISGAACSSWTAILNTSLYDSSKSLTYVGGKLYAFMKEKASGNFFLYVYSGSGTTWTKLTNSSISSSTRIANDGTNIYLGQSGASGSNSVYKCANPTSSSCTSFTNISPSAAGSLIYTCDVDQLTYSGTKLYAAGDICSGYATVAYANFSAIYDGSAWSEVTKPVTWGSNQFTNLGQTISYNGSLYASSSYESSGETRALGVGIFRYNGSSWVNIGGNGLNGSWKRSDGSYSHVNMSVYNGNLYASLSGNYGDANVWKWNGTTWTKIGGGGVNSSWTVTSYGAYVQTGAMATYNGQLYVTISGYDDCGEGTTPTVSLWAYNGSTWQIAPGTYSMTCTIGPSAGPSAMVVMNGNLYFSMYDLSNRPVVMKYDGSSWTSIGTGLSTYQGPGSGSLVTYKGQLYISVIQYGNASRIYRYSGSGTTWTEVGGDGIAGSWNSTTYDSIQSMAVYNGKIYVVTGPSVGSKTIYSYDGSNWANAANANLCQNGSTSCAISSLYSYNGVLYVGNTGASNASSSYYSQLNTYTAAQTYSSVKSSWDTNWHKIAVSDAGGTIKIYIDGVLDTSTSGNATVPDNNLDLLVGASYAGLNTPSGYFNGTMDELRLSSVARPSFPDLLYDNTYQTVSLNNAVRKNGVLTWNGWADDSTIGSGGAITYRLSSNGGTSWQYWNGTAWTVSSDVTQSNDKATVNAHISALSPTFGGITWQAVVKGDGTSQITLNSVSLTSTSDITTPSANASNIKAKKAAADTSFTLASNGWTNGQSPYFSWDPGTDSQSGILGYCLYIGQDSTADPVTTKGNLGASPIATGNNCQFIVSSANADLGTTGYLATPFTTSNSPYYLIIKAIDKAGNVSSSATQFQFRFDNTPPTNPTYITAPSGFVNNKQVNLTWPSSGVDAAADANSGVVGLQYKINNSSWYGDNHSGTGDVNDLLANDGTYTTQNNPDFANLNEGANTVYFRTWDQAGNISVSSVTATIKLNTTGAPSEPLELEVTPATNTLNSFAFDWQRPNSLVGDAGNVTYCYVINNLPNNSNCTYTAPGVTSLPAGPYATQPGANNLYVVARDESSNINYDNYATVQFTANTPAPGIPLNTDISDVSIKTTHNWRLAVTWDVPSDVGAGVALYKVYRSTDNTTYNQVGTSTSTSYIDSGLTQQNYYYYIVACDSTNNCSAQSQTVHDLPTGKFTSPPVMVDDPVVSNITTRRATVSWSTDRTSDSRVAIGTTSGNYNPPETLIADEVTAHSVDLNNLSAGTTYYFVVKWTDEDGNTGHSQELSFTTSPAPVVKEVTTDSVGLTNATLSFTSVGAYKVAISYGLSDSFGGVKSINTSASESNYSINLDGLDDGTKYFFQLISYDSEGSAYPGNVFSFTTPPSPRISDLRFQPVSGEPTSTQQVTWKTNVPTDSTMTYGIVGSNGTDITDPKMTTDHSLVVSGLDDNSVYFLIAKSRDISGNLAVSDRQQFKTALDTRPPIISATDIETSIRSSGSESRGQIVVSWKTDEPATSQVAYGTGTDAKVLNNKTAEDGALSTEHIVIISDLPTSQLYTIQPISKDKAGNQALGDSQTAIIGRGTDDVLTIVLTTLKNMFGL